MEIIAKKCTSKDHGNLEALLYCQKCQIYMCRKCEKIHSELFINHNSYKLNKDINDIFTGFCKVEKHNNKLEYYCKDHNQLCCGLCISKLEGKGNGQHNNCNICFIENIKEEKQKKLNDNIKYLEEISKTIEESIKKLKQIFNEISKNKEKLKKEIQKIFTQLRNEIDNRENKLISEVDIQFDNTFFKEDLVKTAEKIPKKLGISLDNGKKINTEWNENNKLCSIINECINMENNINDITTINKSAEKNNEICNKIIFRAKQNDLINQINAFGTIDIEVISNKKLKEEEKEEKEKKEEKPPEEEEDDIDIGELF